MTSANYIFPVSSRFLLFFLLFFPLFAINPNPSSLIPPLRTRTSYLLIVILFPNPNPIQ